MMSLDHKVSETIVAKDKHPSYPLIVPDLPPSSLSNGSRGQYIITGFSKMHIIYFYNQDIEFLRQFVHLLGCMSIHCLTVVLE